MNQRAVQFLLESQNADGGWGYRVQGMSYVEPTAAVLLALEDSAARRRGRDFLLGLQRKDGGWGIAAMDDESGWMTAWAVIALANFGEARDAVARGAAWLLDTEPFHITDAKPRADVLKVFRIDSALRGFPWQPGDASWVHPTALAVRALKQVQNRFPLDTFQAMLTTSQARVREAVAYLLDRAVASGGWNVGNPWMIDKQVPATIQDTAVALLALSTEEADNHPRISSAVQFLREALANAKTPPELAWGVYALRDWGSPLIDLIALLNSLQMSDGSWNENPFITAIALLAQT